MCEPTVALISCVYAAQCLLALADHVPHIESKIVNKPYEWHSVRKLARVDARQQVANSDGLKKAVYFSGAQSTSNFPSPRFLRVCCDPRHRAAANSITWRQATRILMMSVNLHEHAQTLVKTAIVAQGAS